MIPVLYDPLETQFHSNGIGLLTETIECKAEEERNGSFELTLTYPQDGRLTAYMVEDAIIKAKPNDKDPDQLFRIYKIGKPISGVNTYYAEHISYELSVNPVCRPQITGKNAQEAISQLLEDAAIENTYTAWSDILTRNSTSIDGVLSVRNALGGVEGSVLDTWGGEYQFDNFTVKLHKSRGSDNGVTIRYGKNLIDAEQEKNIANVVTAIFPYCYYSEDGKEEQTFASLPEKYIATPNAGKYARIRCVPVDFSDKFEGAVTEAQLRQVAQEYAKSGIDEPEISITASFQNLKKTKEYQNLQALELVGLCDTVTVMIEKLGISVKAKVVKYTYDVLQERFDSVEIGEAKSNLTKELTLNQREMQETLVKTATRAEKIRRKIEQTIKDVTAAITGNSGGYVVLHPAENPQEIFIMDTDNTATAKNVWRWNLAGLGHSSSGIGGPYTTAITAAGVIVADFIAAGELNGNLLKAGTVQAEALDVQYRQEVRQYADDGDTKVLESVETKLSVTDGNIEAEVKRATKAEGELSASIKANAEAIALKVTSKDVESLIEQKADSIRLKAAKISWSSTYSSMSSDGKLKCTSAELTGTMLCGNTNGYWAKLNSDGRLIGGFQGTQYGYIEYSVSSYNLDDGKTYKGIQIQGGILRISTNLLSVKATSNVGTTTLNGGTGTIQYITDIKDNGNGTITWYYKTMHFENGVMTTSI